MKILIIGATGYLGSAIAERLSRTKVKHEVLALARSDASASKLTAAGLVPVRGDLADLPSLVAAAGAADAVVSVGTSYDPAIDEAAIDAILDALEGTDKPFLYTRTIWVNGNAGDLVIDELLPLDPIELVAWRAPLEAKVRKASHRGIRTVVIRPAVVYGREGGMLADFIASAHERGAARYVGNGRNRWAFVHVDDLADLYLLALEKAPAGIVFVAASGPSQRVLDVAEAASRAAGAGGRTEPWPLEAARAELGSFADALVLDQQASGKRAEQMLGWRPSRPGVLVELERGSYAETPSI